MTKQCAELTTVKYKTNNEACWAVFPEDTKHKCLLLCTCEVNTNSRWPPRGQKHWWPFCLTKPNGNPTLQVDFRTLKRKTDWGKPITWMHIQLTCVVQLSNLRQMPSLVSKKFWSGHENGHIKIIPTMQWVSDFQFNFPLLWLEAYLILIHRKGQNLWPWLSFAFIIN